MRTSTAFGLAGLICATICALPLHAFGITLALRLGLADIVASWRTHWFVQSQCRGEACTSRNEGPPWDIIYHVGGNGPWIKKNDGVLPESVEPPKGCKVEQVHMVSGIKS